MGKRNKVWNHKKMRRSYGICSAGILVLVVLAFFSPQVMFKVRDSYQGENIWQGPRNSLDLEELYGSYGDLRNRMVALAEMLGEKEPDYHLAGTEYSVNQELLDILELALSQECFTVMERFGIAPALNSLFDIGYTVEEWKQYVIYKDISDEEKTMVLVSGWYIELTTRGEVRVKMFVDTETYELYYLKMIDEGAEGLTDYWNLMYKELLFNSQDPLFAYWFDYYEAGESPVQTYDTYVERYKLTNENVMDKEEKEEKSSSYYSVAEYESAKYTFWEMMILLPYFQEDLRWEMRLEKHFGEKDRKNVPGIFSMGIAQIAELIPEFEEGY